MTTATATWTPEDLPQQRAGTSPVLVERATAARACAVRLHAESARLVREARRLREDARPFQVVGQADGLPQVVSWGHGRLRADEQMRRRLDLVEQLGRPDGDLPAPSTRGDRTQLLLAVLRAFDRIECVELETGGLLHPSRGTAGG